MKTLALFAVLLLMAAVLSGCLQPADNSGNGAENLTPPQFPEDNGEGNGAANSISSPPAFPERQ